MPDKKPSEPITPETVLLRAGERNQEADLQSDLAAKQQLIDQMTTRQAELDHQLNQAKQREEKSKAEAAIAAEERDQLSAALAELQERLATERKEHDDLKAAHESLQNEHVKLSEALTDARTHDLAVANARAERFEKSFASQARMHQEQTQANVKLKARLAALESPATEPATNGPDPKA